MKTYYYSPLVKNESEDLSIFIINSYTNDGVEPKHISRSATKLDPETFNYFVKNLGKWENNYEPISDKKLIEILDKLGRFFNTQAYIPTSIIFEIIQDEDGNFYGKELLTGLLFPVLDGDAQCEYFYNYDGYQRIKRKLISKHNNVLKLNYAASTCEVATKNQIDKYIRKNKNIFKRKIKKLYNENVFKKEIIEKKEKELEKQNEYTKLMEEIELLLELLKIKNPNIYSKLTKEYHMIKNSKDNTLISVKPNIEDFKKLISKIKLYSIIDKDLSCYLSNAIDDYYVKMISNLTNDNDLNIYNLDNIMEMFLINKDDYEIEIQRNIIKKLGILYLFVIKNNIDEININKLNESYFKDNLKTILLNMLALQEMGIINNCPDVSFNDDITTESIIDMIKVIEFNKTDKEKIKNLIKYDVNPILVTSNKKLG